MEDANKNYQKSTNMLSGLPKIALIFEKFDPKVVEQLNRKFSDLQRDSQSEHHFLYSRPGLTPPTQLAKAHLIRVSIAIAISEIETERNNKLKFKQSFDEIYQSFNILNQNKQTLDTTNQIVIETTLKEIQLLNQNEDNLLNGLTNHLLQLNNLDNQLTVFIQNAKEAGKQMTPSEVTEAIYNDRDDGVMATIQMFHDNMDTLKHISYPGVTIPLFDTLSSNVLAAHHRINENYLQLNAFIKETQDTDKKTDKIESKIKNCIQIGKKADSLFDENPQRAIPILPLLQLNAVTIMQLKDLDDDSSIDSEKKSSLMIQFWNTIFKQLDQVNEYFDNLATLKTKEYENTLTYLDKAFNDVDKPDLSKLMK